MGDSWKRAPASSWHRHNSQHIRRNTIKIADIISEFGQDAWPKRTKLLSKLDVTIKIVSEVLRTRIAQNASMSQSTRTGFGPPLPEAHSSHSMTMRGCRLWNVRF